MEDSAQRACHSRYILYSAARLRRAGPTVRIHRENFIRRGRRFPAAAHSRDVGGTDRRGRSSRGKYGKQRFRTRRCGENKILQTNCLATNCPLVQFGKIGGKCSSFDSPGSHRSAKTLDTFIQRIAQSQRYGSLLLEPQRSLH